MLTDQLTPAIDWLAVRDKNAVAAHNRLNNLVLMIIRLFYRAILGRAQAPRYSMPTQKPSAISA
jgi:hypothetical protein